MLHYYFVIFAIATVISLAIAIYFVVKRDDSFWVMLVMALAFAIVAAMTYPSFADRNDKTASNFESSQAYQRAVGGFTSADHPEPRVIDGVRVEWHQTERECPQGLICSPCFLPEPDRITYADGSAKFFPSYGCRPDTYEANGQESFSALTKRLDIDPDLVCVEERWRNQPTAVMPEGTVVSFC